MLELSDELNEDDFLSVLYVAMLEMMMNRSYVFVKMCQTLKKKKWQNIIVLKVQVTETDSYHGQTHLSPQHFKTSLEVG